jgi:hypothetical protein
MPIAIDAVAVLVAVAVAIRSTAWRNNAARQDRKGSNCPQCRRSFHRIHPCSPLHYEYPHRKGCWCAVEAAAVEPDVGAIGQGSCACQGGLGGRGAPEQLRVEASAARQRETDRRLADAMDRD